MKKTVTILGIETSCDESAMALVRCSPRNGAYHFEVLEHHVYSQVPTHRKTGGVVPEVAAREHAVRLPVILKTLTDRYGVAGLQKQVDAIAVTAGPGLVTSLLVGVEVARTLSVVWKKPLVATNHLEGHIYANLLRTTGVQPIFAFPLLALIVSGGHTELVLMKKHLNYKLLGSTRDDAAGEAFDKTAKLLGLPYPGGPEISKLALRGNRQSIPLPRPMLKDPNLEFSFAGLKTAVAVYLQKNRSVKRVDVAASIETAIAETLIGKTLRAAAQVKPKTVVLAGGVAANSYLREQMRAALATKFPTTTFLEPELRFTPDNAAMIAAAGAVRFLNGFTKPWQKLDVDPHLPLQ